MNMIFKNIAKVLFVFVRYRFALFLTNDSASFRISEFILRFFWYRGLLFFAIVRKACVFFGFFLLRFFVFKTVIIIFASIYCSI